MLTLNWDESLPPEGTLSGLGMIDHELQVAVRCTFGVERRTSQGFEGVPPLFWGLGTLYGI
jgi:hypothetical protein